ncbi:Protein of unknown function (DUF3052) [Promicromonospora thailandica]|uniref:DUF3052 family protein n=1 Tax=Promicromonospora thailandica TaxID=765201 RepID=A0A9X2G5F8_9MICO|nr:Protein of unknown function (DUF3052) [Promicromonospora thailandica]
MTRRVSGATERGTINQVSTDTQGAGRLGFEAGQVVQEFGWGDDVDEALRADIEEIIGGELEDEDYGDVTDGVILWWREDDGDLTDALVDVLTVLDDGGLIWILTPKPGRPGEVGHGDIQEAATTAGLQTTSTFAIAEDWSATRLGYRGRGK